MKINDSYKRAVSCTAAVLFGENILLLGDSGTGKSTFDISHLFSRLNKREKVAKTASTGIAAQLIEWKTVHSLLPGLPGCENEK